MIWVFVWGRGDSLFDIVEKGRAACLPVDDGYLRTGLGCLGKKRIGHLSGDQFSLISFAEQILREGGIEASQLFRLVDRESKFFLGSFG